MNGIEKMKNEAKNKIQLLMRILVLCVFIFMTFNIRAQETLLIIRPEGNAFQEVVKGITDELEGELIVRQLTIDNTITNNSISAHIDSVSPKIVVLMDNRAINAYRKWQENLPDSAVIPSVACMASFLDKAAEGLKNSTGISYEVPIITSTINLRSIIPKQMTKVGVIHRAFLNDFVQENKKYCSREKIELVTWELPDKAKSYNLKLTKGLRALLKKKRVDALLVLNDNVLLKPELLREVWIPLSNKYRKPVIVGVEVLVQPLLDFGTFAVLPDHANLAIQVAEKVLDIMDNDWNIDRKVIEPPLSVIKVVNLKRAKKYFGVEEKDLENIDKVLK